MTTLDVSIYDYATFEEDCFAANGVERLIVGTSNLGASRAMVMRGRRAGLIVEDLYGFIYYGLGWENRDLDNCLQLASELGGIKRIWLDCEAGFSDNGIQDDTEAPGITIAYRHERTMRQALRVEEAGLQAGIYTGAYWWPSKMGNSPAFSALGLPLWIANYGTNDPNNPRPPITEVNFGGWTTVAAHQYSSTIGLCGRDVRDHNYWFLEEDMTELEDLVLACFSGQEEAELTRPERLARARYRMQAAVHGPSETGQQDRSLSQRIESKSGGSIAPGTTFTGVIN